MKKKKSRVAFRNLKNNWSKPGKIKIILALLVLTFLAGAAFFIWKSKSEEGTVVYVNGAQITSNNKVVSNGATNGTELPAKVLISVPFTSQAPFAVWDAYHEDACEEASIIMVRYYLDKKTLSKETADKEILALIDFEIKNYGGYIDSDVEQMMDMSKRFYNITNMKAVYDFKKEDIKKYLALGKPIIIPAAGRLLGNPNFKAPGPPYHALVLTGYDGDWIITNDPGTRKGENYRYKLDVLYNAIHDFPGDKNKIEQGRKAMIVLE